MKLFGYEFTDERLAVRALTTPSRRMDDPHAEDNQRLEFLGDAVLNFLAADRLYRREPDEREGALTVRRTRLVSTAALCRAAARHGFAAQLIRNRFAAELPRNSKTLADAIEAVIGAAWLDGGLAAAETVYAALELEADDDERPDDNPKGALQVLAQSFAPPRHPVYRLVATAGKAHAPVFTAEVEVEGLGAARGTAGTMKEAEARAAAELLSRCRT